MALYHPPKMITANQSPIITADLAYEGHGKCGNTRILTSVYGRDSLEQQIHFSAEMEGNGNAWRMDIIHTGNTLKSVERECPCVFGGTISEFRANNISELDANALTRIPIYQPFSIMADITSVLLNVDAPYLVVVLYMDCKQS